jgi:hypothetical protein
MPRHSPYRIVLSPREREALESRARQYTLPYFQVVRARMILLASEGAAMTRSPRLSPSDAMVVSLWRKRFFEQRLGGLEEHPGRPRAFPPRTRRPD